MNRKSLHMVGVWILVQGGSAMKYAEFTNKVAIVTGASRGIGRAVAEVLIESGANVLLVSQHAATLQETVRALSLLGPGQAVAEACTIDGSEETASMIVHAAVSLWGRLDYMVNAAGGARVATVMGANWNNWHEDFDVKFWGYLALMRAAIPFMKRSGDGVVVNLVGVAGKDPNPQLAIASAVNGALRAVTKALADEVSPDHIRLINVNPGSTETDLLHKMAESYAQIRHTAVDVVLDDMRRRGPLGRLPTALDVANVVCFLLSDGAALVTGTSVDIDGGVHRGLA